MRHDPDVRVLAAARAGDFKRAVETGWLLTTGRPPGPEVYHLAAIVVDDVFGQYQGVKIACTKPAADALVAAALTPREAELLTDIWLGWWRQGRHRNCPKEGLPCPSNATTP